MKQTKLKTFGKLHRALALLLVISTFLPMIPSGIIPSFAVTGNGGVNNTIEHPEDYIGSTAEFAADSIKFFADGHQGSAEEGTVVFEYPKSKMPATVMIVDYMLVISEIDGKIGFFEISPIPGESFPEDFYKDNTWVYVSDLKIVKKNGDNYIFDENGNRADHTRIEWKNNSFNLTYTAKSTLKSTLPGENVEYQWQIYCYGVNGTELSSNEYADMTDQNEKAEFEQLHKGWINISGDKSPTINVNYGKIRSLLDPKKQVYIRCKTYYNDKTNYSSPITIELYTEESDNKQNTLSETGSYTLPAYLAGRLNNPVLSEPENGEGDVKKTYNIVINYVFENNEIVADPYTANLVEGSSFSQTVTFPTVQGYLPYVGETQQNSIELNYTSVSEDVTINVVYKPTEVNYTVIHYQQNVDNDQYTVKETETKQGLTGSQVPEVNKTYEGFYNLIYERPNIAADGSTVIEVYYDRYYYLMNFDMDGGYGTDPVYARYGATIGTVKNPTKAGYAFQGWAETKGGTTPVTLPTTMPYVTETKTYYAIWKVNETAKVTVVFWGENADDEHYSYLSEYTKEIELKPGTEFTYSESGMLICTNEVHTHTDACLGCGKPEHTHTAVSGSCYTLTCGIEVHTHSPSCYTGASTTSGSPGTIGEDPPENPANGYVHRKAFSLTDKVIYINGTWYEYSGSTASGSVAPTTCGKQETTHTHNNDCYTLTCTTEEHTHEQMCYTCGKEQHTHTSSCYMQGVGLDTKLWKFVKSDTITVAADGSSVVNVYYDRVEYSVQFYNGSGNSEYTDIKITAKWGAYIGDKWPTKNNSGTWAVNPSSNNNVNGPYQVYLQEMPVGGDKFYGPRTDIGTQSAYYYVEILPGETGTETYNNKSYKLHHTDTSPGSGYTVTDDDKYAIQGFTFVGFTATQNNSGNYLYNGAKFYYTRNSYKLTFNDQYTNVKEESVNFEAPLSTYVDYVPEVPSQYEPGSVTFDGWYQNPQCTGEEYKLDEHTMPANDIILYAKWVPVTRNVKFYLTESSTEVYKPETAGTDASFTIPHGGNIAKDYVDDHLDKKSMKDAKPNGDYTFVMWYYYENGEKKPFDPTTSIRKDLTLYGEWSSNTLKEYTVQYVLQSDHSVKVADDLTGSGLAGTTKTFVAKGGTELYADYQEGYFPTVQSQSLVLDIEKETLTVTFEYVLKPAVPYTVKYVEKDTGKSLANAKVVSDNRKAVVTETFVPITGYMPDAYQKRLVVTADGENILYFYYTKDTEHAYYKITHYTQNLDGKTWTAYSTSQIMGDIGTRYTALPLTIPGYTYKEIKYVVNGTEVTDVTAEGAKLTENGLEINLYYVASEYPYQVRYLEQGTGKELRDPKNGTGKYGQIISESAIDIDGYDKVAPTSATLNIRIDEGEGASNLNIITFYYKEKEVTINYVPVGSGSVSPTTETVKVKSGNVHGSTPTPADGYKFVGWYKDADCTQPVDASWVTGNKIVPQKTDGKNVAATYYAKFESDSTSLTITKAFADGKKYDDNDVFVFKVRGNGVDLTVTIKGAGSVTINGLAVGEYTVTELSNWSWRYDQESVKFNGVNVTDGKVVLTAVSNEIVFTNKLTEEKYLEGNASVDNIFDGEKITQN